MRRQITPQQAAQETLLPDLDLTSEVVPAPIDAALPAAPRGSHIGAFGSTLLRGSGQGIFMDSQLAGTCNIAALA